MQTISRLSAPLLALALAACVARPETIAAPRADPALAQVIAGAADQVKRCYRAPRAQRDARDIVTVLRVAYAPDGKLAELPSLIEQRGVTEENGRAASQIAEAAALAVVTCVPLNLPAEKYRNGWDSFVLTFSQKAVA